MRTGIWLILLAGVGTGAAAQDSFQDWAQSQQEEFQKFQQERDRAFHKFLQEEWRAFQMHKGEAEDATPKPRTVPEAPDRPVSEGRPEEKEPASVTPVKPAEPMASDGGRGGEPKAKPEPEPEPEPTKKVEDKTEEEKPESSKAEAPQVEPTPKPKPEPEREPEAGPQATPTETVEVTFLGHKLQFRIPDAWRGLQLAEANKEGVADFWADFAKSDVAAVVEQLQAIEQRLALNDWGYLQLSHALAQTMAEGEGTTLATVWGILLKSGYDARLGFQNDRLALLYNPDQELFDLPYFDLEGKRYYVFAPSGQTDKIVTYEGDYQGADQRLGVALERAPEVAGDGEVRTLRFEFDGQAHTIEVPVSPALVAYFESIPQMKVATYFRYQPTPDVQEALVGQLKEATAGMDPEKQVNFLLRFVQTAFNYETDQEQFGQENYLFPEETLFYSASDCEDRSVLFAFLVRQVLGLEVAVLDYPGHVATAVNLPGEDEGAHIRLDGRDLIVADPTYINANAGMLMPDFRDDKPRVIPLGEG